MQPLYRPPDRIAAIGKQGLTLILFWAYAPYEAYLEGSAEVSAYYLQSHAAYRYTASFVARLREAGAEASMDITSDLKTLIEEAGLCRRGKNDLMYDDIYGSFFVLQAVRIGAADTAPAEINKDFDMCRDCNLCKKACPTGAIKSEGGILKDKCLRSIMNRATGTHEELKALGRRLYGCDDCQRVCPKNKHVKSQRVPEDTARLFNIERLLRLTEQPDAELLHAIGQSIGHNLARPMRLAALACAVAANTGGHKDILQRLTEHKDPKVSANARFGSKASGID